MGEKHDLRAAANGGWAAWTEEELAEELGMSEEELAALIREDRITYADLGPIETDEEGTTWALHAYRWSDEMVVQVKRQIMKL